MKRLVVCCDGTWKSADDVNPSNIEKISRALRTRADDGTYQFVYYSKGVGTSGRKSDRLLDGATGGGLDMALSDAYRFLALNYEHGGADDKPDDIYIFGFSRGAYTARSLAGMISYLGLLDSRGIANNMLCRALPEYRHRPPRSPEPVGGTSCDAFRGYVYRTQPRIRFLGVFDTVGALGVPGFRQSEYEFHNVELSSLVQTARQALAIDERRRLFEPCVWERGENDPAERDVKQVWFEGVHSDIGGGYRSHRAADYALAWMLEQSAECGLAFDGRQIAPDLGEFQCHDSLDMGYKILNLLGRRRPTKRIANGRRVLELKDSDVAPITVCAYAYKAIGTVVARSEPSNVTNWRKDPAAPPPEFEPVAELETIKRQFEPVQVRVT